MRSRKSKQTPRQIELPTEGVDPKVIRDLKTLANHFGVLQRDAVYLALVEFVRKYPVERLGSLPNPFEDKKPPD